MTYEFFKKACLEDGLCQAAIDYLWQFKPEAVVVLPDGDKLRRALRETNLDMRDGLNAACGQPDSTPEVPTA